MGERALLYSPANHLSFAEIGKAVTGRKSTDCKWLPGSVLIFGQPQSSKLCHRVGNILPDWLKVRALSSNGTAGAIQMPCKLSSVETLNNISEDSLLCGDRKRRVQLPHWSQHCMCERLSVSSWVWPSPSSTFSSSSFLMIEWLQVSSVCADIFLASPTFSSLAYHYEIMQ